LYRQKLISTIAGKNGRNMEKMIKSFQLMQYNATFQNTFYKGYHLEVSYSYILELKNKLGFIIFVK
jgi:hypothetical protein